MLKLLFDCSTGVDGDNWKGSSRGVLTCSSSWSADPLSRFLAETMHMKLRTELRICRLLPFLVVLPSDLPFPHHRIISLSETFNMASAISGSFSTFI